MTPRQSRRERREAERKAKKLELKKARQSGAVHPAVLSVNPPATIQPDAQFQHDFPRDLQIPADAMVHCSAPEHDSNPGSRPQENGFVSQNRPSRAEINRANSQFSTGPRSERGKLASSRNSTKHGLASGTIIIPGEDPEAFASLLTELTEEHQPATPTEQLLIKEMAQSYWLTQRAIRLQNVCFTAHAVNEKQLALFLRYQTTHERSFYKALNALLRSKRDAALARGGFVSQRRPHPDQFVRQNASTAGFVSQNARPNPESPQQRPAGLHENLAKPRAQAA